MAHEKHRVRRVPYFVFRGGEVLSVHADATEAYRGWRLIMSKNTSDDIRKVQAMRLWTLGVGRELGLKSFEEYLVTIPQIHPGLLRDDAAFPILVLVEPRLGLKRLCEIGGIDFEGDDETFVPYDVRDAEFAEPAWIRIHDGRRNRDRPVCDCRSGDGLVLTALQGVCAYIHHSTVVDEVNEGAYVMDLSGSVHGEDRDSAADLSLWRGRPVLGWRFGGLADYRCGSASRLVG